VGDACLKRPFCVPAKVEYVKYDTEGEGSIA